MLHTAMSVEMLQLSVSRQFIFARVFDYLFGARTTFGKKKKNETSDARWMEFF